MAFDGGALEETDSYASPEKQYALLSLALAIHERGARLLKRGVPVQRLLALPVLAKARRCKSVYTSEQIEELQAFAIDAQRDFDRLRAEYAEADEAAAAEQGEDAEESAAMAETS